MTMGVHVAVAVAVSVGGPTGDGMNASTIGVCVGVGVGDRITPASWMAVGVGKLRDTMTAPPPAGMPSSRMAKKMKVIHDKIGWR